MHPNIPCRKTALINDMEREVNAHYSLINNNCRHAVNNALHENGINLMNFSFITPNSNFQKIKDSAMGLYSAAYYEK